ncbi:DUF3846 domain-containing protein [Streptomyces genisteinicus]|uniref:DUF3846 domain-containing protein n=1 Tax=Streptomyces genisteinicus TaxID=2768068 RepID=A0A7H0I588_9ACTN|nr:DUF3846 domain-containing protein [Streptomyces genisteinicus]QNP67954.1 DUF3846 domain-containing protein [Streptomyces genisteinicus]
MSSTALALVLRPDRTATVISWPTTGTLATLHTAITCRNVEAVTLSPDLTMWVDEEGVPNGAEVNPSANLLALITGYMQPYFGTAVITGGPDTNGDTKGLTDDNVAALLELLGIDTPIPSPRTEPVSATIPGQRTK